MAALRVRTITLSKHQGQSFGFFLREERGEEGHLIRNLETGSPAELSGLKDGDRVLRVNGTFADTLKHSEVVELVKRSGTSVTFQVLDEASYKSAKENGVDLANPQPISQPSSQNTMNGVAGSTPKPKLCYLVKSKSKSYGFSLKSIRGVEGVFMSDIIPSGVADKAGVKVNDRLLEVNGEDVDSNSHEELVEKVKASGDSVMFLLVDEEADTYYRNSKQNPGVTLATMKYLPHKPRIANLTREPEGYGYYLREDPKLKGHFINDIEHGSPADRAGLKNMDRLVAVNGEEVDHLDHDQVVERIRQSGNECSLLVVDKETDKMYKMGGASPLLYWKEMGGSCEPASTLPIDEQVPHLDPTPQPTVLPASAKPTQEHFKPKLCKLEKTSGGYGFHLYSIQGVPGQYIKEVVKGSVADQAGLEENDIVVEVNEVNVENSTHDEVVSMIKSSGNQLVLLVAEKQAYSYFKAEKIPITSLLLGSTSALTPTTAEPTKVHEVKEEEDEERQKETEREEEEEDVNPSTPPSEPNTRDRTSSTSSSSSEEDEKL